MAHHLDHPRPGQRAAGTLRQQMGVQFRLTFMQSAVCLDLMSGTRQATSQDEEMRQRLNPWTRRVDESS